MNKPKNIFLRVDTTTRDQLRAIAEAECRPMTKQLSVLVTNVYRQMFDVVAVDELPRPDEAESIPVVYVQKRTE